MDILVQFYNYVLKSNVDISPLFYLSILSHKENLLLFTDETSVKRVNTTDDIFAVHWQKQGYPMNKFTTVFFNYED